MSTTGSLTTSDVDYKETRRVYSDIVQFAENVEKVLQKSNLNGNTCEDLKCDPHAMCTMSTTGAQCVCLDGYIGNGLKCEPPPAFAPHLLLQDGAQGKAERVTELQVALVGQDTLATVWRDLSRGNIGRIMIGKALGTGIMDW